MARRLVCFHQRWLWLALLVLSMACGSAAGPTVVDVSGDLNDTSMQADTREELAGGDLAQEDATGPDGVADALPEDGVPADQTITPDLLDTSANDSANPGDAGDVGDAQVEPGKGCVADNSAEAVEARDGFIEVCASPSADPDAVCGDGSPYKFSYRPASGQSKGLLLYFRGGGGCSDYVGCWGLDGVGGEGRRVSTMSNTEFTGPGVHPLLGQTLGIFYLVEPTNPLRQYDQVHIAYCTGDAGLKNEEQVFEKPEGAAPDAPASIKTYFHGQANIAFALDTVLGLFPTPKRLVILGSSAGSWASMASVTGILQRYGDASIPVAYYGEGGIGVGSANWNQMVLELLGSLNGTGGNRLVRFAQFSFISDEVQRAFAPLGYQDPTAFQAEMRSLLEGRAAAHPLNYRYFAIPGSCHTLAQNPGLFQQFTKASGTWKPVQPAVKPNPDLSVGEVNLLPWFTTIIEGDSITESMGNVAGDWEAVSTTCLLPGG